MNQCHELNEFSEKMVRLLVEESIRIANSSEYAALPLAACLMNEALKYDAIAPRHTRAMPESGLVFSKAAKKITKWHDCGYGDGQSA